MRILISGVGVAGPTLAYWLKHHGFEPTLVEKAPGLRSGGYVIDFWGLGFEVAERMGLADDLLARGYSIGEVRMVDEKGARVGGFRAEVFREISDGRYVSIARSELSKALFECVEADVETVFGDEIVELADVGDEVRVRFARGPERSFDLVIGADGLHSAVRALCFGPQSDFEHHLGCKVAAFEVEGYRPRDEDAYVLHTMVGQQLARFSLRDDRTLFLCVFADAERGGADERDLDAQKSVVRQRYRGRGWESDPMLEALAQVDRLYYDRISQIKMPQWTRGRIGLVGDAAFCASLLAGQGSALAMVAAYVMAGELRRAEGDHVRAFAEYERRLRPFLVNKQAAAQRFVGFFAPASGFSLFLQRRAMVLLNLPFLGKWLIGRDLRDEIELPDY